MARGLRTDEAGAIHHVFARGNRAQDIFIDDRDRRRYLQLLASTVGDHDWACLGYCLMTNHLHLLIETPKPNLAIGMQRIHGEYALGFNRRHGWGGHLFQGRYGAVRMKDDAHLIAAVRYLDQNPVEAGLVQRPEDWQWSSSTAIRGGPSPPWLAVKRLRSLLAERIELLGGQTPLRVG